MKKMILPVITFLWVGLVYANSSQETRPQTVGPQGQKQQQPREQESDKSVGTTSSAACTPQREAQISCATRFLRDFVNPYGKSEVAPGVMLCDLECFDSNGSSSWRFKALQVSPYLETQIRFSCLPLLDDAFYQCSLD